jgi:hypothetical protein
MLPRTLLSSINGYRQWKNDLSLFLRVYITALLKANESIKKISTELKLSPLTIPYTLEKNDRHNSVSLEKSRRPLILSPTGQRHVLSRTTMRITTMVLKFHCLGHNTGYQGGTMSLKQISHDVAIFICIPLDPITTLTARRLLL